MSTSLAPLAPLPSDLERDFNNGVATGAIAEAYLEMARLAVADKDMRTALDYYNKAVNAKPSPAVRRELEQVLESIRNPNQPNPQERRRVSPFGRKRTRTDVSPARSDSFPAWAARRPKPAAAALIRFGISTPKDHARFDTQNIAIGISDRLSPCGGSNSY